MYTLLIVDDEIHIANGIKASMDWIRFNIIQVLVASNMKEAQDLFRREQVDILICDIEMPGKDGFELLSWVKEHVPLVKSVFLTCHAEFSYAQRAIQLGSLDYILKPVPEDILETTLRKMISAIEIERRVLETNKASEQYAHLWSAHKPLLMERFWVDLLEQRIPSNLQTIMMKVEQLKLPIRDNQRFLPILLSVRRWRKELNRRDKMIMDYALRKTAEETLFTPDAQGQIVSVGEGIQLVIANTDGLGYAQEWKGLCSTLISAANRYLFCDLSCYIGEAIRIQDMKDAFDKLKLQDRENVTSLNEALFEREKAGGTKTSSLTAHTRYLDVWSELLKCGNKERAISDITSYLDSLKTMQGVDHRVLQIFYQDFLQMIHHTLKAKAVLGYEMLFDLISPERNMAATRSILDMADWAKDIIAKVTEQMASLFKDEPVSDIVKQFVQANLDRDFSRQELADYLAMSPDYVVKRFKRETGKSLSNYIVQERVNKAIDLLTRTEMPISEVAMMVGYTSFSYFSKVFKNTAGMSPQEYRRMHAFTWKSERS